MAIPENVEISGDISFDRYLAIDGSFEGTIVSHTEVIITTRNLHAVILDFLKPLYPQGDIYVGPHGLVNCDLKNMGTIVIEGTVVGDITAHNLVLRGHASVTGNVRCSTVEMGPQATMIGQMKSDPTEQVEVKAAAFQPLQKNNILIILDPQIDFHSNGRCPIDGADQNSKCIAKFIVDHKEMIEEIIVGLENHHVSLVYIL
jgi:cytoskeletal protein CcmA (bactofilin family)